MRLQQHREVREITQRVNLTWIIQSLCKRLVNELRVAWVRGKQGCHRLELVEVRSRRFGKNRLLHLKMIPLQLLKQPSPELHLPIVLMLVPPIVILLSLSLRSRNVLQIILHREQQYSPGRQVQALQMRASTRCWRRWTCALQNFNPVSKTISTMNHMMMWMRPGTTLTRRIIIN